MKQVTHRALEMFVQSYHCSINNYERKKTDFEFREYAMNIPREFKPYKLMREYIGKTRGVPK